MQESTPKDRRAAEASKIAGSSGGSGTPGDAQAAGHAQAPGDPQARGGPQAPGDPQARGGPQAPEGQQPFILVAEDDPTNQYVFRKILEKAGYEVTIVEDGQKALEACRFRRPDLILLDMMMPVLNGYEAATIMSQDPALDGVPILALTANAMRGDELKTREAGCDDHIPKPVQMRDFLQRVRLWLERDPESWMPQRMVRRRPPRAAAG